jgi:hypothetical protein
MNVTKLSPQEKAERGMFLSLRELAPLIGFARKVTSDISKKPGFPILAGKGRYQEFLSWYRRQAMGTESRPQADEGHQSPGADMSDVPLRSNGSRQVLRSVPARRFSPAGRRAR